MTGRRIETVDVGLEFRPLIAKAQGWDLVRLSADFFV
jgi:hypothetical protein